MSEVMSATRVYKSTNLIIASTLLFCSTSGRPCFGPEVGGVAGPRGDRLPRVRPGQRVGPDHVRIPAGPVAARSFGRARHGHPQPHTPVGRESLGSTTDRLARPADQHAAAQDASVPHFPGDFRRVPGGPSPRADFFPPSRPRTETMTTTTSSQKLDHAAPPLFGRTANYSNIWTATTSFILGIESGKKVPNETSCRRVDDFLRCLHEGDIIDDDGLEVARLTAEVSFQANRIDVFIGKATKAAKAALKRGEKGYSSFFDPVFRIGSARPGSDEEEFRCLRRTTRLIAIIDEAKVACQTLRFAAYQMGLDHDSYRKLPEPLQDAVDDPELPGVLVRSLGFADAVFARLNADYPSLMAELPQYRPSTRAAGDAGTAARLETDAVDDAETVAQQETDTEGDSETAARLETDAVDDAETVAQQETDTEGDSATAVAVMSAQERSDQIDSDLRQLLIAVR